MKGLVALTGLCVVFFSCEARVGGGAVYIYTDYNAKPKGAKCPGRPVYVKNGTSSAKRVTVYVTAPKYMTACKPKETTKKPVSVPANGEVFLGYNRVNCASSVHGIECSDVDYRL